MKKILVSATIAAAMSAMIFLPSCNKDDNVVKISHKDSANVIEVLTKSQYAVGGNFSPSNGAKDIYVGTDFSIKPGVALNTPFEVKLADQTVTYRYDLKSCTITDASGADFATGFNYSEQDTLITINSKILNGNTEYTLSSTIALMQQINGEWQPVVYNGDAKEYVSTSLFTTCQAADTLRPADILFSYPIDRQLNYMPKEYQEGYIMLSYKYPELFNGASVNDMKVIIKNITDDSKAEQSTPFTVKESHEVEGEAVELGYSLKNITFDPNQIYSLAFYCGDKKVHQIYFRTSFYETLKSKLAANDGKFDCNYSCRDEFDSYRTWRADLDIEECFDKYECQSFPFEVIRPNTLNTCLITFNADFDNWQYYNNTERGVYKLIYENYSMDKVYWYDEDNLNSRYVKYSPSNAYECYVAWKNGSPKDSLTNDEINKMTLSDRSTSEFHLFVYDLIQYYLNHDVYYCRQYIHNQENKDYGTLNDIQKIISDASVNNLYERGNYPYIIAFRLPGKELITYQEKHIFSRQ